MRVRVLSGAMLCAAVVLLLSGCKSERLVYGTNIDDTWHAVLSAVRHASGAPARRVDNEKHTLSTRSVYCGSRWSVGVPNTSDDPDSIRYGTTREDYRARRTYWYATVECRPADWGTEVVVRVHQETNYDPSEVDSYRNDRGRDTCPEADNWESKFFRHLNEHLGEPVKVKK